MQPTRVLVRVTAGDAKIIGSGVGGARVTVRNAETGAVLAEGVQEGSTGDTERIMGARERGATVFDTDGAAGFVAELELAEPTRVVITGEGPLGTSHAMQRASRTMLLVPGQDVLGEGVIIELLGFTVELLDTPAAVHAGQAFQIVGTITMLCGCPTEPGGLWDSEDYEIELRAVRGGEVVGEWPMTYTGETSHYGAEVTLSEPGTYQLIMLASDPDKANFGMATSTVEVSAPN